MLFATWLKTARSAELCLQSDSSGPGTGAAHFPYGIQSGSEPSSSKPIVTPALMEFRLRGVTQDPARRDTHPNSGYEMIG
jgi:hypothetical protein